MEITRRLSPTRSAVPPTRLLAIALGLVGVALRRLRSQVGLTLLSLLGVALAVGLITSASLFAQAVDTVILRQELAELSAETGRSPFATRIYVFPSGRQPLTLAEAEQRGRDIAATLSSEVGLPVSRSGLHVESGSMMLRPLEGDTRYGDQQKLLGNADLTFIAGVAQHVTITAGDGFDAAHSTDALDVWMHVRKAEEMGIKAGETLGVAPTLRQAALPIRIRGLWQSNDPTEPFWFNDPDTTLRKALLVRRDDYIAAIEPMVASRTGFVAWPITLDDQAVVPERAASYVEGIERGITLVSQLVPGAELDVSPVESLGRFTKRQNELTGQLLSFNLPAFGILLAFLALTSALIIRWQRRETSIMVSRGLSTSGVLAITLVEALIICILGLPLGIGLSMLIAVLMGYTDSFLNITQREALPVSIEGVSVPLALVALGVALIFRLLPAARAARQSVVAHERRQAREQQRPFWQRAYLDILLLIAIGYVYRQMERGTLSLPGRARPEELYSDPLLILAPALMVLAGALLVVRFFPFGIRAIEWFASKLPAPAPYLALRQLSRQSQAYSTPLILLIVALGLGVYTLSLAASLDQWLEDRIYYRVGADAAFRPYVEALEEVPGADWIPPPDDFRTMPGVLDATRFGDYTFESAQDGLRARGRFLGIDRLDFPSVAWYREDLSDVPLGELMNLLAERPDAILVPQQLLDEGQVRIGDQVRLRVGLDTGIRLTTPFIIAGGYRHFPTVYQDQPAIIGNLEHLYAEMGSTFVHDILIRVQPGTDVDALFKQINDTEQFDASRPRNAQALIAEERAKLERVGVFGTLSAGFLASVGLAALGLLIHCVAALREQGYRFAVLRAIGMTRRQLIGQVALEYGLLTLFGACAAAGVGALTATLCAPFFRSGSGTETAILPPLMPVINYEQIMPLVGLFAGTIILLELLLMLILLYRRLPAMIVAGDQG